jgi:two-component system CheB/CheR fusion protein
VAACATGEEAYSVAIAFHEAMAFTGHVVPFKLFATDVHKRSIEHASRGCFSESVLQQLPPEVLQRYFTRRSDGYQIIPEIRRQIVFAPHNVLRDAPFTDLDFISCRNLLIYLQPAAQRRALSLFHYGLRVGGILLLGGSESPGELAHEFDVISERHRLYQKSRDVRLAHNLRSPLQSTDTHPLRAMPLVVTPTTSANLSRARMLQDDLLNRFLPPSIVVDKSRMVVDTFAGAEKLLKFPSRQPSLDILELVDREIRTTLSGAIMRAMKDQVAVRFGNVRLSRGEAQGSYDLSVSPLRREGDENYYLISFEPIADLAETPPTMENAPGELDASRTQIRQLEDDLRYSRENLQATIEELETSNEELQATNEELIASNEELQSTNEELHSLNEELYTVNAEHQRKIEELAELNRDISHLLENTDVATVFLDRELRIRRFTSQVRQVFELIDEDVGRSIHVFASKLRITDLFEQLRGVLETGKPYEREVLSVDGTSYLMRLLPYRSRDLIDGIVMMWVDVSSLEVLRGRLRWLSAIVESTSDAIIGQDLKGIVTSWNRGAEQLYGYAATEIIGRPISVLVPENRKHELEEYRVPVLRGEQILSVDTVRLHKDGQPIEVSLTISPVMNSENQVIGISKIARDISHRIAMEQEIRDQVQRRERFLAMLSHELRNPLNAVSAASALLSNARVHETSRLEAARVIQRQVGMINHLLADLLDVARIAENRINLKFEPLDLRSLRGTVEEIVQSELDRHGCGLQFEMPDQPLTVDGDRTRLIQIQVNLIHNAAKYSGSTQPIRVVLQRDRDRIHLAVIDQGKGIPPEQLENIFEPFAQLDTSPTQTNGGLGLGLSLAKSLVQMHGGTIVAESEGEGTGCTFHVWLPANTSSETSEEEPSGVTSTGPSSGDNKLPAQSLHVCIVEDMADSREMVAALLELDGHRVSVAADGESAVKILVEQRPDVALIDIGLPDISGYEVARRVRASLQDSHDRPKLIALTGYGQPADVDHARQAGFDLHLVKPVDPERLQQVCEVVSQDKP